jgi:hypothetical protein
MLQTMLDSHPRISCGPESGLLQGLDHWLKRHPHRLEEFGTTEDEYYDHVRDLFSWLHRQRADRLGKPRWADKTPSYAIHLPFINSIFPHCQVVQIVRDPLDVVDSWRRKVGARQAFRNARMWESHVRGARNFGMKRLGNRYLEIHYEQLVHEPEKYLRALLEWLGEPWDAAVLNFRSHSSQQGADAERHAGVFTSSVGIGRRPLSRLIELRIKATAGPLIKEFGY